MYTHTHTHSLNKHYVLFDEGLFEKELQCSCQQDLHKYMANQMLMQGNQSDASPADEAPPTAQSP